MDPDLDPTIPVPGTKTFNFRQLPSLPPIIGLSLLIMQLVSYPDSDSDDGMEDEQHHQPSDCKNRGKRRKLATDIDDGSVKHQGHISLPALSDIHSRKFYDMYAAEPRISAQDDPSLHGGKKRITPHVVGNWPSHVYLEWVPTPTECELITSILSCLEAAGTPRPVIAKSSASRNKVIHPLHVDGLHDAATPRRLHISLSATLNIKAEDRHDFLDQIRKTVKAEPFCVHFTHLQWVSNYDKSRWFLVLKCQKHPYLEQLLQRTNSIAANFEQNILYQQQDSKDSIPRTSKTDQDASIAMDSLMDKVEDPNVQTSFWVGMTSRVKQKRPSVPNGNADSKDGNEATDNQEEQMTDGGLPFHISIAWSLSYPSPPIRSPMSIAAIKSIMDNEVANIHPHFERVKVKVGDQVTTLPLGNPKLRNKHL